LRIAVVVLPGFSALDVALVNHIFHCANQIGGSRGVRYSVQVVSAEGGLVAAMSDVRVWSEPVLSSAADVVFVSSGDGAFAGVENTRLHGWIRDSVIRAPRLIGVADDSPLGTLVKALSVIKQDLGAQTALRVSERIMPDGSRWLSEALGDPGEDIRRDKIRDAADWIAQNCARPITIRDVSRQALMSERTLLRHFKAVMGMSPSEHLLKVRLELACHLLVSTALPIDKIARRCSFRSGMALAKLFQRRLSVSASEYRAAARGLAVGISPQVSSEPARRAAGPVGADGHFASDSSQAE
jgi:transcriptional regulator GlxA family with amidase domain